MRAGHFIISILLLAAFLGVHFVKTKKRDRWSILLVSGLVLITALGVILLVYQERFEIEHLFVFTAGYAVTLYVFICDVLKMGFAQYLTRVRGNKWVKELDYIYLTFGSMGIFGAINRIGMAGRISKFDVIAPMLLATAVVVRFVKTRAEIGGWNKPGPL